MNVINRIFLAVVLFSIRTYTRMGVNPLHLRSILTTKLIMDDRRPNTFHQTQHNRKNKLITSATIGTMCLSALLGTFFLAGFQVGKNYLTHLTIYFSFYIFMLASTLISDFTSVLIDVRDNYIILPKPVNDRTVVVARLLHITIHLSKLVIPMCLPGIIYIIISVNAWGAFVFFLMVILVTMFALFLINALYILILKVTSPQKFMSVIGYFQIFFAVFIYGGYQFLPKLMNKVVVQEYDISSNFLIWLAPPYWFAGAWQLLTELEFHSSTIIATILSLVVPFLSIWAVVKYFAPSFNQKLSQIAGSSPETISAEKGKKKTSTTSAYVSSLSNIFAKKGAERMAFLFCWKMTSRSKDFKLKVYPGFGYLLVYLVVIFLSAGNISLENLKKQNYEGKMLLLSIVYFGSFMLIMAISQIVYTDKFKAAWIYFITPIKAPGVLITGAFKAAVLKFYIPIIVFVTVPAVFISGVKIIPNVALGLFNDLLICSLIAYLNIKQLPFSEDQSTVNKGSIFIKSLFALLVPAVFALGHFLIYSFFWVVIIFAILSLIALWLVMSAIKDTTWQKIKMAYED